MTLTRDPPGPRGHWLLGDAGDFRRDPLKFLVELRAQHGPVAGFRMGPFPCYLLSDPDDVHTFLTLPSERIGKPALVRRGFRKFFGDSLVVLEGDEPRTRRRLMQPSFHPKRIDGYAATMVEYSERALACWPAGESRELESSMMDLALEVIVKTMFGADLAAESEDWTPARFVEFQIPRVRQIAETRARREGYVQLRELESSLLGSAGAEAAAHDPEALALARSLSVSHPRPPALHAETDRAP